LEIPVATNVVARNSKSFSYYNSRQYNYSVGYSFINAIRHIPALMQYAEPFKKKYDDSLNERPYDIHNILHATIRQTLKGYNLQKLKYKEKDDLIESIKTKTLPVVVFMENPNELLYTHRSITVCHGRVFDAFLSDSFLLRKIGKKFDSYTFKKAYQLVNIENSENISKTKQETKPIKNKK